jgi:DNA-binding MarR family transcriptional regulator
LPGMVCTQLFSLPAGATRLHRRPPAETDMQEYFRVSPPSVHQMVLSLERARLIKRLPRTPRSIEVLVDPKDLPELI